MIRVLHIFHEMSNGGNCHFVMNYYRHMNRDEIQFDFLTSVSEPGYFDEEILSLGGRLFHACPIEKNPVRNYLDIARIVRENQYQIVHRHTGSAFGYFDLRAAKHGGAKYLILHAHSTDVGRPAVDKAARLLLRMDCHRFACSQEAGEFLFGKGKSFEVIPNAIEINRFVFQPDVRETMRKDLGLGNKLVIGHIGWMQEQKNHKRLLSIFAAIHQKRIDSALVCVGDGKLVEEIKSLAARQGLGKDILFLGQRSDVEKVLQCFDVFLLPSLYEGFPVTLVEAQANGLPCFASKDAVPQAVNMTGNVRFISLAESDTYWADQILKRDMKRDKNAPVKVRAAGYDIVGESEKLANHYFKIEASIEDVG